MHVSVSLVYDQIILPMTPNFYWQFAVTIGSPYNHTSGYGNSCGNSHSSVHMFLPWLVVLKPML